MMTRVHNNISDFNGISSWDHIGCDDINNNEDISNNYWIIGSDNMSGCAAQMCSSKRNIHPQHSPTAFTHKVYVGVICVS